ncbi:MAG: hypothetical protein WD140_04160, partial [bacterium]
MPVRAPGALAANAHEKGAIAFPARSFPVTLTVYRVPELRDASGLNVTVRSSVDHWPTPNEIWGWAVIATERVFIGSLNVTMIDASAGMLASAAGAVDTAAGGVVSPAGVSPERPLTAPQPARAEAVRQSTTTARTFISWPGFDSSARIPSG